MPCLDTSNYCLLHLHFSMGEDAVFLSGHLKLLSPPPFLVFIDESHPVWTPQTTVSSTGLEDQRDLRFPVWTPQTTVSSTSGSYG